MSETRVPVIVALYGFEVTSPGSHEDDWPEQLTVAANEIASDVGAAFAGLGSSCIGGTVIVSCEDVTVYVHPGGESD